MLALHVRELHDFLREHADYHYRITIAENGSTDVTLAVARRLARELAGVRVLAPRRARPRTGAARGLADERRRRPRLHGRRPLDRPRRIGELVEPLLAGQRRPRDRLAPAPRSRVTRGLRREVVSRAYNMPPAAVAADRVRRRAVRLQGRPARGDPSAARRRRGRGWFFDTELLFAARRGAYAVREIPVRWVEDRDSRVRILATAAPTCAGSRGCAAPSAPASRSVRAATAAAAPREPLSAEPGPTTVRRRGPGGPRWQPPVCGGGGAGYHGGSRGFDSTSGGVHGRGRERQPPARSAGALRRHALRLAPPDRRSRPVADVERQRFAPVHAEELRLGLRPEPGPAGAPGRVREVAAGRVLSTRVLWRGGAGVAAAAAASLALVAATGAAARPLAHAAAAPGSFTLSGPISGKVALTAKTCTAAKSAAEPAVRLAGRREDGQGRLNEIDRDSSNSSSRARPMDGPAR